MVMDLVSFGERVRRCRKAMGLTQGELAARTGISVSFLGHIERGTRKAGLESLVLLANAMSTTADDLLQDLLNFTSLRRHNKMIQLITELLQEDFNDSSLPGPLSDD